MTDDIFEKLKGQSNSLYVSIAGNLIENDNILLLREGVKTNINYLGGIFHGERGGSTPFHPK